MNLEDLRPGMWVTVLDPVVQEITEDDDLSVEGWVDADDRRPNLKHGAKACVTSMALHAYRSLAGKPLLVSCIEPPFVFCDILAMAACEVHPVLREFTILDFRHFVFMPISQRYVDAMIDAMLSIARPEEHFEKHARSRASMIGSVLGEPVLDECPIRSYIKHIEKRRADIQRAAHLGI